MDFNQYIPFWDQLTDSQQQKLSDAADRRIVPKNTIIYRSGEDCLGLLILRSGQIRSYIISEDGREITLYRLIDQDICLFSASCMMKNIQFDIAIETEKDTELWIIPANIYQELMDSSLPAANFTNQLMASRFSEVMWLMEQIMWKSFDQRLAAFLLEESSLENSQFLHLTHEKIANHLGTAREVVTRMLRYFQSEGIVTLTRGTIEILDTKRLQDFLK